MDEKELITTSGYVPPQIEVDNMVSELSEEEQLELKEKQEKELRIQLALKKHLQYRISVLYGMVYKKKRQAKNKEQRKSRKANR